MFDWGQNDFVCIFEFCDPFFVQENSERVLLWVERNETNFEGIVTAFKYSLFL